MATAPKKSAAKKTGTETSKAKVEEAAESVGSENDASENEQSRVHKAFQDFTDPRERNIWMRGLIMILFAIFIYFALALLGIAAIIQFLWMLISKEPNGAIAKFGNSLGKWLEHAARFQAGATEKLPFPWSDWE